MLPSLLVELKPVGTGQWRRAGRDYFHKLCKHAFQLNGEKNEKEIKGDGINVIRFGEASNWGGEILFLGMLSFSGMLMVFEPPAHDRTKKVFSRWSQQKKGQSGNRWETELGRSTVKASPVIFFKTLFHFVFICLNLIINVCWN